MSDRSRVTVYLVVIAAFHALVTEEVNGLVVNAREPLRSVCLRFDMLQTVGLVPAFRKDIKRDLTSDGEAERKGQPCIETG